MQSRFTFDSGRLCLDFLATLSDRDGAARECLLNPADLSAWCTAGDLLDRAPRVSADELVGALAMRESLYNILQSVRAGEPPRPGDIDTVNHHAAGPAIVPILAPDGRTVTWNAATPAAAAVATVARDAIDLLAGSLLESVRECAGPACSMLFLDVSRPGQRRWCAMARCGNRAKKTAFRARQGQ